MGTYTLFNGPVPAPLRAAAEYWAPTLLIEWPSRWRVFFGNLAHLLFPPPPVRLSTPAAEFWPDVFVPCRQLRFGALSQSLLYHGLLVALLASSPKLYILFPRVFAPVEPKSPFQNSKIVYYPVSEYLPPINEPEDSEPAPVEQKGEPALAKQRIVSVPRLADNHTQTIITPSPLKLDSEVSIPNLVAWAHSEPPVPTAVANNLATPAPALPTAAVIPPVPENPNPKLIAPVLPHAQAVAPPEQAQQLRSKLPQLANAQAVAPPPTVEARNKLPQFAGPAAVPPAPTLEAKLDAPGLPTPAVVAPPPTVGTQSVTARMPTAAAVQPAPVVNGPARGIAGANASRLAPQAVAPPPDQRVASAVHAPAALAREAMTAVIPPPVSAPTSADAKRIIALGIHPATATGPVEIPQGTRRGTFAAGPEGRADAPGTPTIHSGGTKAAGGAATHDATSPTAGITVAAGPVDPGPVAVATNAPPSIAKANPTSNSLRAALGSSRAADIARTTRPGITPPERKPEDEVFGDKRYYSMTLNMPNLASGTGSWIIRFAELHQTRERGELTAPVVTQKVDPGYPTELMRTGVRGMVVLYAVIHADGSVGEVRVLRSLDDRLDANARRALLKWHFLPGKKNGAAVDLEAVVQIPFRPQESF